MIARVLVLILLAMNAGVAAWWLLRPEPLAFERPPASEPGVPILHLLGEARSSQEADQPGPAPALASAERLPGQCHEVGPFVTRIDLRRAMNALAGHAQRIQFRETRTVIRRGYRVFLPSPGSREAALALARQLSARGLDDYYVVTAGDDQNTVSLGLYRERGNAEQRQAEVLGLGFAAEVAPRNEELPQYWIDLEVPPGTDWRLALGGYAGVGSRPIPCQLAGVDTDIGDRAGPPQ